LIAHLDPVELAAWRADPAREPPLVIDVREPWELAACAFDDDVLHIPLGELPHRVDELPRDRDLVVLCHHGVRSVHAVAYLVHAGFGRVYNLRGGVAAWADDVDPAMPRY
jgi:rhodanese-related sulfurtransferase